MKNRLVGIEFLNRQPFKRRIGFVLLVPRRCGNRGTGRQLDGERQNTSQREDGGEERPWRRGNSRDPLKKWRGGGLFPDHSTLPPDGPSGTFPWTEKKTPGPGRNLGSPQSVFYPPSPNSPSGKDL